MRIINSFISGVNYSISKGTETINKIVSSPSCVRKTCQLVNKCIEFVDLKKGTTHLPDLVKSSKSTISFINFYFLFNQTVYFLNPFDNSKIDQEKLIEKLSRTLEKLPSQTIKLVNKAENATLAEAIVKETLQVSYYCKSNVQNAIRENLLKKGYSEKDVNQALKDFEIVVKPRSLVKHAIVLCGSICTSVSCLKTLEKWDLLNLSKIADQIGSQAKVFSFFIRIPIDIFCDLVTTFELTITIVDATVSIIKAKIQMKHCNEDEKKRLKIENKRCLWNIVASTVDMAATTMPLLWAINPTVLLMLSIINKSTGILCFLNQPNTKGS